MNMRLALLALLPVLASCGSTAATEGSAAAPDQPAALAEELCETAAASWDGIVVAAYETTVGGVRAYAADPHGATGTSSEAPVGAADIFPAGWNTKDDDEPAAKCYIDGHFAKGPPPGVDGVEPPPSDRGILVAAEDVDPALVAAGTSASLNPQPPPPAR